MAFPAAALPHVTAAHTPGLSVVGIVSSHWHVPTEGHVHRHNAAPVHCVGSVGTCWWPGFYYYCHGYYYSKGAEADQHSEPGSSPLAEPPSAAATARSAPLPSDPSGSHSLLASTAWRGTRGRHWCRGWVGRAGSLQEVQTGISSLPGWAVGEDTGPAGPSALAQFGLTATAAAGKGCEGNHHELSYLHPC